jgi:predicted methyltransferase
MQPLTAGPNRNSSGAPLSLAHHCLNQLFEVLTMTIRALTLSSVAAASALFFQQPILAAVPAEVAAAVADTERPTADRDRDVERRPAETLAFAGIHAGQQVAELMPGGGYYTRLLSTLVGVKGKIIAVVPAPRPGTAADAPDRAAPIKALAADPHYANVSVLVQSVRQLSLAAPVDVVWTSLNYHDVHNVPDIDMGAFNKAIFDSLKPGGLYLVIDHAAAPGAPANVTSELHRIDPEMVKSEVTSAGFVLEAESPILLNAADSRTAPIFDPAIRGRTAQFILRFRKPRS